MTVLQLDLHVRDYDEWKRTFDDDPADRAGKRVRSHRILRSADEPSHVVVQLEFDSARDAQQLRDALRELWERVGDRMFTSATAHVLEEEEARDYG